MFSFVIAGLAGSFGLLACSSAESVGPDSPVVGSSSQAVEEAPDPRAEESDRPRHRGHMDPARFVERFDTDKNGTVELAELPDKMREHLAKADGNNDGALSTEELKAAGEAFMAQRFAKKDANGDGVLVADEVGERRWKWLSAADGNADGKVSQEEIKAAAQAGKLGPPDGHPHRRGKGRKKMHDPGKFFEKFDANGNGTIELSELPEHKREHMTAADANKDGAVSRDELEAHWAAKKARSGEHRRGKRGR